MKKMILMLLVVLVSMAGRAQFKSANLQAAGLTCAMCTKAINKALEKVPFRTGCKSRYQNLFFPGQFQGRCAC